MTTHHDATPFLARNFASALAVALACACGIADAAQLTQEGTRLRVAGPLDDEAAHAVGQSLADSPVRAIVFDNVAGGSAAVALALAQAIEAAGIDTETIGACQGACAYAFLAGRHRRFGRGLQIHTLLIPAATRPAPTGPDGQWEPQQARRLLTDFMAAHAAAAGTNPTTSPSEGSQTPWQPARGVLFIATPTLFGRVYNSYYCDGSQGRDLSRCDALGGADPYKFGALSGP